ncbi:hypothetical protein [Sphingobacterium sp.]|uniref:hypothetical protein n=1 Tax=Sphingobacterium sp. TaxID=341027 RepID=UPI003917C267
MMALYPSLFSQVNIRHLLASLSNIMCGSSISPTWPIGLAFIMEKPNLGSCLDSTASNCFFSFLLA